MSNIIWQPYISSAQEFNVSLDVKFAKKMISAKIGAEHQEAMNKLGRYEFKKHNFTQNPYLFHEDTAFVRQIYIGSNGVWLATNLTMMESLLEDDKDLKEVKYYSHNADTSSDKHVLLALFSKWIEFSDCMTKNLLEE